VVVGLGMGHNRSRTVMETPGTQLIGVCDVVEERAKRSSDAFGVPYALDVQEWLDNDQVEVVYVLTETGRHAEIAIRALEAGKHVISTKPMEANLAACDKMIRAAEANDRLLAVDFGRRFGSSLLALKESVAVGDLGRPLGATFNLKIQRTMEYFRSNGGWRGTRRWDGGGVLSNQAIHHIDEIVFVLGVPARVRCDIWTQDHDIEAEDLGSAVWQYADGMIVTFTATTSFPHSTWYSHLELHGTEGAYYEVGGGPFTKPETKWFVGGKWSETAPRAGQGEWVNTADNVAAALRQGAPLVCDGREGRRTQSVLDAMYRSAYEAGGTWVDVAADLS
jgi:predicted dehydrogenase